MAPVPQETARIAILIPCYNESATIAKVVGDFRRELPEARVYVFDNNSSDSTAALAAQAGATVVPEKKQGKGHVVAAMFEKVDADAYVMVDGDDTYPAENVRLLLKPILEGKADMTVGRREAVDHSTAYRRFHVFGNWLVRRLINFIFRANLQDIMSGYRAFTRDVAKNVPIMAYGFDIETEMSVQCLYRKWVIQEVPVPYRSRPEGSESKLSTFRDGIRVIFRILSLFRSYKPLTFFGAMGIAFLIISGGLAAEVWFGHWDAKSGYRLTLIIGAGTFLAMSLIAMSIGVIVQLVNFRFLELDSVLRRRQSSGAIENEIRKNG